MFPEFYQRVLKVHLNESQCLILEILVLLLQSHRQVKLSSLAQVFPQPIKGSSRRRCIQRFLLLPQLSLPLLWHPIIKHWLKREFKPQWQGRNRLQRRHRLKHRHSHLVRVAIDRTQWRQQNLFVASLVWNNHALALHWCLLPKVGSSNLGEQKRLLRAVLKLCKTLPIVIIGDREFHSPKLAQWLQDKGVDFIFRQKGNNYLNWQNDEYLPLNQAGFQVGDQLFFKQVYSNKGDQLGPFNLVVYWKRPYQGKKHQAPWYLLTSLSDIKLTLSLYRQRWSIETMFKDCKSGGYNLEDTHVSQPRFLALFLLVVFAYALATMSGLALQNSPLRDYLVCSTNVSKRPYSRISYFALGLARYGRGIIESQLQVLSRQLLATKPHKHLFFQKGNLALSQIQQVF